jgi:hypothetical protein
MKSSVPPQKPLRTRTLTRRNRRKSIRYSKSSPLGLLFLAHSASFPESAWGAADRTGSYTCEDNISQEKTMKNAITLHRAMGAQIVSHLSQFGDLPSQGILAGQAVDSAITDLFGHGGGVYNDLDIFRNVPGGLRQGSRNFATKTAGRASLALSEPSDYSGMLLTLQLVQSYQIKSVSRKGMLNFVNCSMDADAGTRQLTTNHVLSGFDLNCTRVGVDLSTGELTWDKHYEEFLRSRQLRIAMMHTPWHTFLRLAKKSEELPNVYVDLAAAAEACVGVASSTALMELKSTHNVSMLFGERQKEQADATRSIWTPYFELETKELYQSNGGSWREDAPLPSDEGEHKQVTLYGLSPRGALSEPLQTRCDKLGASVVFFAQKVIDEGRRAKPGSAYAKLDALTERRKAVATKPDTDYVLLCAKMFGTDYVQGQALPEVGDKLASWLSKHKGFMRPLLGLSLAQQHQIMQDVVQLSREYGEQHYNGDHQAALGVLELQASGSDLLSKERMLAILDADYVINGVPFEVKPLPLPKVLPARFKNFVVKELLNGNSLRQEGRDMHHCVGGYSSQIRNNQSRIVSIKHRDDVNSRQCSTIEFRGQFFKEKFSEMNIRIGQNRTLQNKDPSVINQELAKYLNNYLAVAELVEEGDVQLLAEEARIEAEATKAGIARCSGHIHVLEAELRATRNEMHALEADVSAKNSRAEILHELAAEAKREAHEALVATMDPVTRASYEIMLAAGLSVAPIEDKSSLPAPVFPVACSHEVESAPEKGLLQKFGQRLRNAFGFMTVAPQDPPIAT